VQTTTVWGWIGAICTGLGLAASATGCGRPPDRTVWNLQAPDPADRIRALQQIAAHGKLESDPAVVAAVVERLDDEDEAVRFFAAAALIRLTGERLGYRPFDPPEVRRVAVDRWRARLRRMAATSASAKSGEAAAGSAPNGANTGGP